MLGIEEEGDDYVSSPSSPSSPSSTCGDWYSCGSGGRWKACSDTDGNAWYYHSYDITFYCSGSDCTSAATDLTDYCS